MITTYYLEMLQPPADSMPAAPAGVAVQANQRLTVAEYRELYDAVGRDYNWGSRKRLTDDELTTYLTHPQWEIHLLTVDGATAGFAELDLRQPGEAELVQFGLLGAYIGRGLGKWFLRWTIDRVWSAAPRRFWLHTCTHDHPRALGNYQRAGFVLYRQETR